MRGSAREVAAALATEEPRGEFTFVIAPPKDRAAATTGDSVDLDPLVAGAARARCDDEDAGAGAVVVAGDEPQGGLRPRARARGGLVTLARVVGKGKVVAWGATELEDARATAPRTLLDIGTGDGRFVRDCREASFGVPRHRRRRARRTDGSECAQGVRPTPCFVRGVGRSVARGAARRRRRRHRLVAVGASARRHRARRCRRDRAASPARRVRVRASRSS